MLQLHKYRDEGKEAFHVPIWKIQNFYTSVSTYYNYDVILFNVVCNYKIINKVDKAKLNAML